MADAGRHAPASQRGSDRRGSDRRESEMPFEGADRRGSERRSGRDRRTEARTRLQP